MNIPVYKKTGMDNDDPRMRLRARRWGLDEVCLAGDLAVRGDLLFLAAGFSNDASHLLLGAVTHGGSFR